MARADARTWGMRFEEFVVSWFEQVRGTDLYLDLSSHHDAVDENGWYYQIKGCQKWRSNGDYRRRGNWRLWHEDHEWLKEQVDEDADEPVHAFYVLGVYDEGPGCGNDPRLSNTNHPVLDIAVLHVYQMENHITSWGPSEHRTKPQEQYQLRWKNVFDDGLDPEARSVVDVDQDVKPRFPTVVA